MLYPKNIEQKLGFDKIRTLLAEQCVSSLGRAFVEKIRFSDNYELIDKLIRQTDEFKAILQVESGFPEQNFLDVSESLSKAVIEGAFLTEDDFFEIKLSLRTIQQILTFFKNKAEGNPEALPYPTLQDLSQGITVERAILGEIDRIIDDRGIVRDNASPELVAIRRKLITEQSVLRKTLDNLLRHAKNSGWINDEMSLTVRNGRMVIPILAEHKRKLKGFVHDESATGQTVYLEPTEVLDANNEIRELEAKERREIVRILEKLTDYIRPHVPNLRKAYFFLGLIDFIRAKAKLANLLQANYPQFADYQIVDWMNARHPLLYLSFKKMPSTNDNGENSGVRSVVPLSVKLDKDNKILIVSGPNAGGKSVMLKTIGLIQYMFQCGLLVPMSPDSKIGIFKNIFIDIGDEQSIENDLSTYSSHLTNMKHFLASANKYTLFLIDEFGTGTEPSLGGAIAESILENLNRSGALGVINTHYTNLKVFADKTVGLFNGAMKFDAEHLEPLYELETGKPGSSFAIEVAQKIGLPKQVIEQAKRKLGRQQMDFEKLIKELEIEKKVFSEKNLEFTTQNQKLKQTLEQYNGLKNFLDIEKKKILNEAKQEAKNLVKSANQKIEQTIREIKEGKADKELTKLLREDLQKFDNQQLKPEKIEEPKPKIEEWETTEGALQVGNFVRIKGQNAIGEILVVKGKDAELSIGDLKTTVKINRLEKVSKKEFKEATKEEIKPKMGGVDLNEKMTNFSFNLDIRGKRGEEALGIVDSLMNDALMLGYPELRIVHGKGDGILRTLIRTHLKGYKEVAAMNDEHADRGGAGVTVVRMK